MGQFNSSVKGLIYRIKELTKIVQDIDTRLSMPGLSPGKRQALIKDKTLKIGKVKSLAKRIEDLTNGNILTITFENKGSGERFRITYTRPFPAWARRRLRPAARARRAPAAHRRRGSLLRRAAAPHRHSPARRARAT